MTKVAPEIQPFIGFTQFTRSKLSCANCFDPLAEVPGPLWIFTNLDGPRPLCPMCAKKLVPALLQLLCDGGYYVAKPNERSAAAAKKVDHLLAIELHSFEAETVVADEVECEAVTIEGLDP